MIANFLAPFGLMKKPNVDNGPRYGDANDRCMAVAIDFGILFLLLDEISVWITKTIYGWFNQLSPMVGQRIDNMHDLMQLLWQTRYPWAISNGLIFLLMGLAIITCQMIYGTTPGKWILGLKIVRRGTLEPVARWRYVLRFLGYVPACLPLMIGVFWMSFNKERRCWQDYIAGTVVINTRPRGWVWLMMKRGFFWLKARVMPLPTVEDAVGEPAPEQRHEDGSKPVE